MLKPANIERALRGVDDQPSFLAFLADTLGWPIDPAVKEVRDIAYGWSAADLRAADLDETLKARQIASLDPKQPWGIFLLEFKRPDAFLNDRGITGTLRRVLRGLVESRAKDPSVPSWKREHLLFICTHDYRHFRIAYFKKPSGDLEPGASKAPPLAAFGWGPERSSQTAFRYNLPHLEWPEDPADALGWVEAWTRAFDVERVTTKFFDDYTAIHKTFVETVRNVDGDDRRKWIASICLNRLMFVYFLQRRGFLDRADSLYLENHFAAHVKKHAGQFYRRFLTTLFFDGFATQDRPDSVTKLIGDIKYLNGGLFVRNPVELAADAAEKPIDWPDESFDAALKLFARYSWNLDDAASGDDNEINPDVLGYIFERYINDRADMGAYYTKEDITDYIGKNAILPFLLDRVAAACPEAFKPGGVAWRKLAASPSTYIYPSVRRGVLDAFDKPIPLPADVAAGVDDVAKRSGWNRPAPAPFGLPTETWREHVARRQRCLTLHETLAAGEVSSVNDLITLNLDVTRFTLDLIADGDAADAPVVDAFAAAIETLSVLDPTCGSGAFLFAALNLLTDVYDACLTRMDAFVKAFASTPEAKLPRGLVDPLKRFRATIDRVNDHASRGYFVAKQIIVNNLYGVDLMPEAVEICKLRLFLRLVGKVDRVDQVEPLPDIDFNVQPGNTLVGFASLEEVKASISYKRFDYEGAGPRIEREAAAAYDKLLAFRAAQNENAPAEELAAKKKAYRDAIEPLRIELNSRLAAQRELKAASELKRFFEDAKPFHWCAEFFGQMRNGGFDIIVGNPPYVEYKDIRKSYEVKDFATLECGDLYAFTMERAYSLSPEIGRIGMIVPISLFCVDGFRKLQKLSLERLGTTWVSSFSNRPAQLFEGAQKRLTIILGSRAQSENAVFTTRYFRWRNIEFPDLFRGRIAYSKRDRRFAVFPASLEKLGSDIEISAFAKLAASSSRLNDALVPDTRHRVYYTRKFGYFLAFLDFIPSVREIASGSVVEPSELKILSFADELSALAVVGALFSSTFFWFWNSLSDCRNVNRRDLLAFPFVPADLPPAVRKMLAALATDYLATLRKGSYEMQKSGLMLQTFDYAAAKSILDKIDHLLGKHFGLSPEEIDFVVNYDLKYRIGEEDEVVSR